MKYVIVVLLVMMVACGAGLYYCSMKVIDTASEISDQVTGEGGNLSDPLGALSALGGLASNIEKLQEEIEELEPVEPVHLRVLIDALTAAPDGWTAQDARGSMQSMGNFKISQANRRYENGAENKTIEISISDWAFNRALYAPFFLTTSFSQETTEGYNKGIKIGEDPGREEFQFDGKQGERTVLYHKRYSINVKGTGIEPAELEQWYKLIPKQDLPE